MAASRRSSNRPRVVVVGSGLAGLTTAYLLVNEGADVWLVDKAPRLGFHAWSVELDVPAGKKKKRASSGLSPSGSGSALATELEEGTPTPTPRPRKLKARAASAPLLSGGVDNTVAVDVPMRSFQGGYYPLLIALYRHLRLPLQSSNFTFSFATLPPQQRSRHAATRPGRNDTYFIHSGASGASLPSLPAGAWRSPLALARAITYLLSVAICYLILVVLSFASWHNLLPSSLAEGTFREVTDAVADRLERPFWIVPWWPLTPLGGAFRSFAADIVLPLFSAVGTMTDEDVWETPALHILEYIHAGLGTSHYTLGGGRSARDVARMLAASVRAQGSDRVRLGTAIRTIKYRGGTSRSMVVALDGGDEIDVDHVVVATQASTARALLETLEPSLVIHGNKAEARRVARMRTALADVTYRDTIVVTHRDHAVLPYAPDVRDINLVQPPLQDESSSVGDASDLPPALSSAVSSAQTSPCTTPCEPGSTAHPLGLAPYLPPTPGAVYTMATHVLRPRGVAPVLQTTNPVVPVDADTVLGVARLERALPPADPRALASLRPPVEGDTPLVYLAGSYAYPGIPLLEGCVGSARRVVDDLFGTQHEATGGVDWSAGRGSLLGRAWRWRRDTLGRY